MNTAAATLLAEIETDMPQTTTAQPHRYVGKRVLKIEATGLLQLAEMIDDTFDAAIEILAAAKGHIILTGIGKSGHIAHKIAATMASTGSPAFFVHPAEASHGDLGMIKADDVILALSESGESAEMLGIYQYAAALGIPLIAITRKPQSTLAKAASIVLLLPEAEAACPLRLAPTTSTTMMLGLGDALAIALLEKRGFTADDFRQFHPGGKLGKNLLRVIDLMHTGQNLPLVLSGTNMMDAILEMSAKRLGCTGVINAEGVLCGIVTDGDLRRNMVRNITELAVEDIMTKNPKTISATELAKHALALMNERQITTLFVLDNTGKPQGILHIHDCIREGLE